jgi:hypothetical protein
MYLTLYGFLKSILDLHPKLSVIISNKSYPTLFLSYS